MENQEKEMFDMSKIEEIAGLKREMGPFSIEVQKDDLSIVMRASSGWMVSVPPLTETWAVWCEMLRSWNEDAQRVINLMVKGVVFPCAMRLIDVDSEYIADIMTAHEKLTERKIKET